MTREEAIKNIKEHCYFANLIPQAKEALDMAIEALEQEPCEDCISKKAVLDKINEVCFSREQNSVDFRVAQGSNGQRDLIINFIENLPSVKPKSKTDWIPVSERLPEESLNSVIGWDVYRERCVFVQFIQGHWQIMGSDESFDIQAWMPLPAPYKGEETYGKPLKWIKASDIQPDDEWMQENEWDEIYKQEENLPDINVGNIKESEEEE